MVVFVESKKESRGYDKRDKGRGGEVRCGVSPIRQLDYIRASLYSNRRVINIDRT